MGLLWINLWTQMCKSYEGPGICMNKQQEIVANVITDRHGKIKSTAKIAGEVEANIQIKKSGHYGSQILPLRCGLPLHQLKWLRCGLPPPPALRSFPSPALRSFPRYSPTSCNAVFPISTMRFFSICTTSNAVFPYHPRLLTVFYTICNAGFPISFLSSMFPLLI